MFGVCLRTAPFVSHTELDGMIVQLTEGARLDQLFAFEDTLAKGGHAAVFSATVLPAALGLMTGQRVAVKLFRTVEDTRFVDRERRTFELLDRAPHTNLMRAIAVGRVRIPSDCAFAQEGDDPAALYACHVMPLMGCTSFDMATYCSPRDAAWIVMNVCAAVEHLHDLGYVHLDIKPDNVLIDMRGDELHEADVVLCDYTCTLPKDTASRGVQGVGTPQYMPSEVLHGKGFHDGTRIDSWLVGVLLALLLTHKDPVKPIINGKLEYRYVDPAVLRGHDDTLVEIARRLTAMDPRFRKDVSWARKKLAKFIEWSAL